MLLCVMYYVDNSYIMEKKWDFFFLVAYFTWPILETDWLNILEQYPYIFRIYIIFQGVYSCTTNPTDREIHASLKYLSNADAHIL